MSLNYWFDKIDNYKEVVWIPTPTDENPDEVTMNPVTNALIFGSISVGLGEITDKNIDEWVARFRIIEKLHGHMLVKGDGTPWFVTNEEFVAHIGLRTNVSNESRAQWMRRLFGKQPTSITDEFARDFRREQARREQAEEAMGRR